MCYNPFIYAIKLHFTIIWIVNLLPPKFQLYNIRLCVLTILAIIAFNDHIVQAGNLCK
jgi:hypothetical protein